MDTKLIREFSGHRSDALHAYEITSHDQRSNISRVIAGNKDQDVVETQKITENGDQSESKCLSVSPSKVKPSCSCNNKTFKMNSCDQLSEVIGQIVKNRNGGKAKVKIEIENI